MAVGLALPLSIASQTSLDRTGVQVMKVGLLNR
jgi:hypothetical protein